MFTLHSHRCSVLMALVLCSTGHAKSSAPEPVAEIPGSWQYVGGDEFDGSELDSTKWNVGLWWENADLNVVTHEVSGGCLKLYPKLNSSGKLISRTIDSDGKFYLPTNRTYYVEFRAQLPDGPGRWPALWLFGHDDGQAPSRPELDLMETGASPPWGNGRSSVAIKATSFTDDGMNRFTQKVINQRGQHSRPKPVPNLTSQAHVFGAVVNPAEETVTYYVDGEQFAVHTLNSTRSRMFLVISDQYDGSFNPITPADPATTRSAAVPFIVDYVRVFRKMNE